MQTKIVITGTRGIPNIMGGVETHVEELAPRLVALGYDVTVIRRSAYVTAMSDAEVKTRSTGEKFWHGVRLVDIPSPKKKSMEAFVHTWRAILYARRHGADIVHVNAIGPALMMPLARLMGLKTVFTHHGPDYDRDKWGVVAKNVLRLGEWLGCRCAHDVIVISHVIKDLIAKNCHRIERVHLIYNGVPQPDICHEPEYFDSLGIEEGKYILGMCRFVPEKHLHDLVEAYTRLPDATREQIRLVLAGDTDFEDDYSRQLKAQARANGVVLTGFVRGKKLHSLLTNALCYSLPSSHEGLPIALLEAMSYHLPVVVSAIPANLEVGLDARCYHKVGDVEALSAQLAAYAAAPLQRITYDMSKYNWDTIANQVSNIYKTL